MNPKKLDKLVDYLNDKDIWFFINYSTWKLEVNIVELQIRESIKKYSKK